MDIEKQTGGSSVVLGDIAPLDTGAVAAACISLGWRVFPLVAGGGTPAIKNWPSTATRQLDVVEEWWGQRYHGCGVGVVTGPTGSGVDQSSVIWVLDLDVKNGVNGIETMRKLAADEVEHGGEPLPRTFTVRTRSGGLHLYFRWPSDGRGIRNSTGMIGPGVDVRGDRGYVRAPTNASSVEDNAAPAVAPDWLVERARWSRRYANEDHGDEKWRAVHPSPWMTVEDLIKNTSLRLVKTGSGGRNDALNRSAFSLGLWGYDMGVTRDQAWSALKWACERNGLWEEEPEGCLATFASGWESGIRVAKSKDDG